MDKKILSQLPEFNRLIWGTGLIKSEVFQRWCQGFSFSSLELSALTQVSGGPCAVIATTQAAILCEILFIRKQRLNDIKEPDNFEILLNALLNIIMLAACEKTNELYWFFWSGSDSIVENAIDQSCENSITTAKSVDSLSPCIPDFETFLDGLRCYQATSPDELRAVAMSLLPQLSYTYGVLCFLYSVLFTHGLQSLKSEMGDESDVLIDPIHGHSSQCLINLFITGHNTPYLFDGERVVEGFALRGICEQPKFGFLTYFEAMRYCEVGWFLKNPCYPIWILGSETHLTVLASFESSLVSKECTSKSQRIVTVHQAEQEFQRLSVDEDTGGFISSTQLEELMSKLSLSPQPLSLEDFVRKLDPENLGIILKKDFLQFFFPEEMARRAVEVRSFQLIHYNGLERSNLDGKVQYNYGEARLIDPTDELTENQPIDRSPIHQCLATKWPTIRVKWNGGRTPSLN